uniref:GPI transamidase component PIG-T-like n=1 Tax=Hirondellea gigas TaxID=1518452 RepID=A0A2P2I5M2_9CRUS
MFLSKIFSIIIVILLSSSIDGKLSNKSRNKRAKHSSADSGTTATTFERRSYPHDATAEESSQFTEELLVRPLPSGHVYSHFEFTTTWSNPEIRSSVEKYNDFHLAHYDLFPRALGEVVEKYHVRELHLTLSQGLWRHHKWGYPVADAPPGATLWVWFNPAPKQQLDQTWRDLVNALSGLFCASLNFIDGTNTASPNLSYRPAGLAEEWYSRNSSFLRYAALARENVCTENLTPWKKLLPCDTKAGLSSILFPGPLYSANYHSLGVHLRPACQDVGTCHIPQLELLLSVSLVQQRLQDGRQDFTLRHLYSSPLFSSCPLAHRSMLYVDVTGNEDLKKFSLIPSPDSIVISGGGAGDDHSNLGSSMSSSHRAHAVYDLQRLLHTTRDAVNIAVRYSKPHVYGVVPTPPLLATRYIAGYGQEGGSIRVTLTNSGSQNVSVVYLELLPWYLRLYLHPTHRTNTGYLSQLVTARDRERGWVYESVIQVPGGSTVQLSLPFTRALLKWLEYPPDANHGFYLPAATLSVILPDATNVSCNSMDTRTLLEKLQVSAGPSFVRIHTETLLVSLPTPDFSMPYNVICLACTVVALAFGPIHNITTKRLTLKKIDTSKSFMSKLSSKLKRILRMKDKDAEEKSGTEEESSLDSGCRNVNEETKQSSSSSDEHHQNHSDNEHKVSSSSKENDESAAEDNSSNDARMEEDSPAPTGDSEETQAELPRLRKRTKIRKDR